MPVWERAFEELLNHLRDSLKYLNPDDTLRFCNFILETKDNAGTLYLVAAGRSLDVLTIFGARLMQPPISLVARPLALSPKPQIAKVDSALICTGTGETGSVLSMSKSWQKINKNVGLITSLAAKKYPSKIFNVVKKPKVSIFLPGITGTDIERRRNKPDQIHSPLSDLFHDGIVFVPSPTKFELTSLLFLESIITELYNTCKGVPFDRDMP